ncbi:MAG: FKBP-type peptidyl-prolyl cis-trans isomerase [Micrococcales bacterium]|nr:FKBP-type peptidyl-prolyl cis-trans isomerase [Micrococcales bacterium]
MRPVLPAIAAAAVLALGLSACSSPTGAGTAATKNCPAAPSGSSSQKVKVSGAAKAEPTVSFDGKLSAKTTERTVVSGGKGAAVKDGAAVTLSYAVFDGATGKKLGSAGYGTQAPQSAPIDKAQLPSGIYKALVCTTVGSRVVAVVPPREQGQAGQTAKTDVVFVLDVRSIVKPPKPLKPAAWTQNVPAVDLKASPPVVTVPDTAPTPTLQLKVLEPGSGTVVKAGDSVTLDYQGTSWDTKKVFDQSYGKQPTTFATGQVIPGFTAALVGQKVGSTVLVTIPPKDAYGTDSTQNELANQTLVFLIQIRKTASS